MVHIFFSTSSCVKSAQFANDKPTTEALSHFAEKYLVRWGGEKCSTDVISQCNKLTLRHHLLCWLLTFGVFIKLLKTVQKVKFDSSYFLSLVVILKPVYFSINWCVFVMVVTISWKVQCGWFWVRVRNEILQNFTIALCIHLHVHVYWLQYLFTVALCIHLIHHYMYTCVYIHNRCNCSDILINKYLGERKKNLTLTGSHIHVSSSIVCMPD